MTALLGLMVIAFAVLSKFVGVTMSPSRWAPGLISRDQDPDSFRKAVGFQLVVGLLFIIGWFINYYWHVLQRTALSRGRSPTLSLLQTRLLSDCSQVSKTLLA
jgi:hypothetical protein